MYGLEYSSLILDIILGFICAILGLLHFFDVGKYFEKVSGIIGLATGIITFVLTLVYICYSGYIFTNDYFEFKLNGDGAFAEKTNDGKFKCIYFEGDDYFAILAKYNDLGKKQYNYQKDRHYPNSKQGCEYGFPDECTTLGNGYFSPGATYDECKYIYLTNPNDFKNKYIYDRWVTTLIFSCFIVACAIGLAIFGFLLFKNSGNSGI